MTAILAIDQGTTSTRSIVFDSNAQAIASAQAEFAQHYPAPGWVEHDAEDLWTTTLATARDALDKAGLAARDLAGIGITNQRETTLVWDRETGSPIHRAIVWQDRRTADMCARLRQGGHEAMVRERTGLLIDPYFSGTKIAWVLDHVPGARERAEAGKLVFGTVDTWLLWRLTDGRVHATDATNASRTLLLNLATGEWDAEMLRLLRIPRAMLPEVRDSASRFGETTALGGTLAVLGIAGDQQAALVGQACFEPGMLKSTYGTGCFALLNTGTRPVASTHRLLTTIGYQLKGSRTYALEGSIFVAGAAVQWLRDGLRILEAASESGALADASDPAQAVVMVPAFTGLGAPYWKAEARGAIYGLTRGTTRRELARAALESVGYQTLDLLDAMRADWAAVSGPSGAQTVVRVDGGMTASDWTMQFLSDVLAAPVDRPKVLETTALGAAFLAGLEAGVYPDPGAFARTWALERRFAPKLDASQRRQKIAAWREAVARTLYDPPA